MVDLGSLVIMWCYVMLHWNHSAEAASRALPSRVHAQPDSTRLTRLEIVSSEVEQSHRSGLMTSDDFCQRKARVKLPQLSQSHIVTYCHILSHIVTYCHILLATLLPVPSLRLYAVYVFLLGLLEFFSNGPQGVQDHKAPRLCARDAVHDLWEGQSLSWKKLAMDRSLRPPIFKLQWSKNNTNDNTNVQMQSSSWQQKLRDKWGQVIFWML